jgi:hypothetical protein
MEWMGRGGERRTSNSGRPWPDPFLLQKVADCVEEEEAGDVGGL